MKLIYAKGACSLSVHILLEELGIAYEREAVSLRDKTKLEEYTPKSYVPVLVLDNGEVMAEASCILQYLCEKQQRLDLIGGAPGSLEKFRCIEWLDFVSTEIHKAIGPLFHKNCVDPLRLELFSEVEKRLDLINDNLESHQFLTGNIMTIADMYLIVNLHILDHLKFDLNQYSNINRYMHMMDEIPSVERASLQEQAEGRIDRHPPKAPLSERDMTSMGLS
jgi:glutathione S-transferase